MLDKLECGGSVSVALYKITVTVYVGSFYFDHRGLQRLHHCCVEYNKLRHPDHVQDEHSHSRPEVGPVLRQRVRLSRAGGISALLVVG